jgi:hypothetical protein
VVYFGRGDGNFGSVAAMAAAAQQDVAKGLLADPWSPIRPKPTDGRYRPEADLGRIKKPRRGLAMLVIQATDIFRDASLRTS